MIYDSTGKQIWVGDRVRFRGEEYTIESFLEPSGEDGIYGEMHRILFVEPQHIPEVANEFSVDKI